MIVQMTFYGLYTTFIRSKNNMPEMVILWKYRTKQTIENSRFGLTVPDHDGKMQFSCALSCALRGIDTFGSSYTIFYKRDNFCDFLFAVLLSYNRIIRQWRANARMTLRMSGMNLNLHFAHARRHIFAWRVPFHSLILSGRIKLWQSKIWRDIRCNIVSDNIFVSY